MVPPASFQNAKISVWWDIENCPVPRKVDPFQIAQSVSSTVRHVSLEGSVTIDAFGDTKLLDQKVLGALSSTGINVNHIPRGNKDAADKAILVAMLFWALDNAPPSNLVLVSGDGDFANALHRLRLKGYNIILMPPDQHITSALRGAVSSVWYWTSVVKGHFSVAGFSKGTSASQQMWVSADDMKYEFPNDVWMDLGLFLCCERNRQLIMKSRSRHEAAWTLSNCGPARIQHLCIGQIILLLNQSIRIKKWLRICGKGWSSVAVDIQLVMVTLESTAQEQGSLAHVFREEQPGATGYSKATGKLAASYTKETMQRAILLRQSVHLEGEKLKSGKDGHISSKSKLLSQICSTNASKQGKLDSCKEGKNNLNAAAGFLLGLAVCIAATCMVYENFHYRLRI